MPTLKWRLQDVEKVRPIEFPLSKAAYVEWSQSMREAMCVKSAELEWQGTKNIYNFYTMLGIFSLALFFSFLVIYAPFLPFHMEIKTYSMVLYIARICCFFVNKGHS